VPRVPDMIVMLFPLAKVTTPVKSSIVFRVPESTGALVTERMPSCEKSMVMPFAVVTALFRLKSTFKPTFVLLVTVSGDANVMT